MHFCYPTAYYTIFFRKECQFFAFSVVILCQLFIIFGQKPLPQAGCTARENGSLRLEEQEVREDSEKEKMDGVEPVERPLFGP